MQVLVNFSDIEKTDAIDQFVREKLLSKLGHLTDSSNLQIIVLSGVGADRTNTAHAV